MGVMKRLSFEMKLYGSEEGFLKLYFSVKLQKSSIYMFEFKEIFF